MQSLGVGEAAVAQVLVGFVEQAIGAGLGRLQPHEGNKSRLVAGGVLAGGLAQRGRVGGDIEDVVHHLKRQAQAVAVATQAGERVSARLPGGRTHHHAGLQQRAGLAAVHVAQAGLVERPASSPRGSGDGQGGHEQEAARAGLVQVGRTVDMGSTQLWTRVNSLDSPWGLDDITTLVTEVGDKFDVIMIPKVEGPEDIHYVDRLLAQLEAKAGLKKPLLIHAILETARGVANVEEICGASPRMQGLSLGPADLAANRRMKTTRVGGGHPDYVVRDDPNPESPDAPRNTYQQDLWHYTLARMVDACVMHGILPFYGPFGDIKDVVACEDQFRNAYLLGCVGAWSLHPAQIDIARRVFSPRPSDVAHAMRVIDAMGDGTGAIMLDGKMEDDASVKQCRVIVQLARELSARDPELTAAYGF